MNVDFHSRHSLSAGGPGASSALGACGVSLGRAFPAGVSYLPFQSTLLKFQLEPLLFTNSNCLVLRQLLSQQSIDINFSVFQFFDNSR